MPKATILCLVFSTLALAACGSSNANRPTDNGSAGGGVDGPPVAEARPVTDELQGIAVTDPYRWLESWEDPAVQRWSNGQNEYARRELAKLPFREEIRARLTEVLASPSRSVASLAVRGNTVLALVEQPPQEQPFLVVMNSIDGIESARVLIDPNLMDESGAVSIDWFRVSPDGSLVAVSQSRSGTESGDVHVYEVATGRQVHEVIPRVNGGTAGGDLAWAADGSGFFYTRYPREGERPAEDLAFFQQVYFHRLGTPTVEDRYELGKELPRIAEIELEVDLTSGRVLATVQNGDGGDFALFLRSSEGEWKQFSEFGDGIERAVFGKRDDLYLVSRRNAPRRRILRAAIDGLEMPDAATVVPEGDDALAGNGWGSPVVLITESRLFAVYQLGGPTAIRAFDLDGKPTSGPELLPVASVGRLTPLDGDRLLFRMGSFLEPSDWYLFDAASRQTRKLELSTPRPVDTSAYHVVREQAISKDGTKIPLNILERRDAKADGSRPCVVTGYGGFGISRSPYFKASNALTLEQGIAVVETNLRGGSEFGEEWHLQGNLTNKQNVFDDFAAAIDHVVERGYCARARLAIMGGSNGGLLVGAAMTQRPDKMKAVVAFVGYYDMLRYAVSPNGQFNIPEYGSVEDPAQFRALLAYSPYHHVVEDTRYPAALFLTGANDPRVAPWHSRKMVARLQAANAADTPILLRTSATSGHGGGKTLSETIEEYTDVYAFLLSELGVAYRAAPAKN